MSAAEGTSVEHGEAAIRRSGLVVAVPEAEQLVSGFRHSYHADAVAKRIPAHVTILFPFIPVDALDVEARTLVRAHFAEQPAFEAALIGVGSFPEHVWLAPAPRHRFVELIAATCVRFPDTRPYEGAFDSPEPHLTVGEAAAGQPIDLLVEAAGRQLGPGLPVSFRVDAVTLFEEQADGTWSPGDVFPLG